MIYKLQKRFFKKNLNFFGGKIYRIIKKQNRKLKKLKKYEAEIPHK